VLEEMPGSGELCHERLLVRESHVVLGSQDLVRQPLQRIVGDGGVLLCAKDEPDVVYRV
jgi:hypothetical protein